MRRSIVALLWLLCTLYAADALSPPQRRALFSATTWTPAKLTGLVAWYKADVGVSLSGSNVTGWADQSGHGYNLVVGTGGTSPVFNATGFNGRQTIAFTAASSEYLVTSTSTSVGIVNMGSTTTASGFAVGQGVSPQGFGVAFGMVGVNENGCSAFADSGCFIMAAGLGLAAWRNGQMSTTAYTTSTNYRFGSIFDGANNTFYLNNAASTPVASTGAFFSTGNISIGSLRSDTPLNLWDGPLSEIVLTNTALSSTDRGNLDNYFRAKWGL